MSLETDGNLYFDSNVVELQYEKGEFIPQVRTCRNGIVNPGYPKPSFDTLNKGTKATTQGRTPLGKLSKARDTERERKCDRNI